jgi:hypothetical protein
MLHLAQLGMIVITMIVLAAGLLVGSLLEAVTLPRQGAYRTPPRSPSKYNNNHPMDMRKSYHINILLYLSSVYLSICLSVWRAGELVS